jgi:hypothetical protein
MPGLDGEAGDRRRAGISFLMLRRARPAARALFRPGAGDRKPVDLSS